MEYKIGDLYETASPIYKKIIIQIYNITDSYIKVEVVESHREPVVTNYITSEWPVGMKVSINKATFDRIWKKCKDKMENFDILYNLLNEDNS